MSVFLVEYRYRVHNPCTMYTATKPMTFADFSLRKKKVTRTESFLEKVNQIVDFRFAGKLHKRLHRTDRGRKPFETVVMFKIILLQQWFGLSDAEAEELTYDRQSFQKFVGISADTDIPDETTICRFRKALIEHEMDGTFFREVEKQMRQHGVEVTSGKIVDATISEVPKGRKKDDGSSTRDEEASFTKKNGRTYHGYKGHMSTDTKGKFIQACYTSTAKDHDSKHTDQVLDGTEESFFGDSAYISKERKKRMRKEGKLYAVIERAVRGNPLSSSQKKRNRKLSSVRCRGEHPFAEIKKRMKFRLRYCGLRKTSWQFTMVSASYNLKRLIGQICPAQKQALVWCT